MSDTQFIFDYADGSPWEAIALKYTTGYSFIANDGWFSDRPNLINTEEMIRANAKLGRIVTANQTSNSTNYVIVKIDGVLVFYVSSGSCHAYAYGESLSRVEELLAEARVIQKVTPEREDMMVPISFWSYSNNGPSSVRRNIDGLKWNDIKDNYTLKIKDEIKDVVVDFKPDSSGQLILWTGPPGTGKTTAIRSLAYEWKNWCELHYITDVEKFFGSHADYMIDVLLNKGQPDYAHPESEGVKQEKWKLLILEDAGEFLQPTAKMESSGPALSRFLNVVDGLIGHGLRILVLVTTNEPIKSLHEAVARPGRCAADVDFKKLTAYEGQNWLDKRGVREEFIPSGSMSIADLYGKLNGTKTNLKKTRGQQNLVGFTA